MNFKTHISQNQTIHLNSNHLLSVKREDLIHPYISGNKFRKLKYNVAKAQEEGKDTLLTFGGAFSNHIAAVAAVGSEFGFKTIGLIRGEELVDKVNGNPTLKFAQSCGMQFKFVTREAFRTKISEEFLQDLEREFGNFYLIPEGGTNTLAITGCEEILTTHDLDYDFICCSAVTGGTLSGIINASKPHQKILGFPALKGDFLQEEISKFAKKSNWQLITAYHFGGYAKINQELIVFINRFYKQSGIPLDPIYTAKMCYGIADLIQKGYFEKGSKILLIHTGGLQGIEGMNQKLQQQKLQQINV